ncbi:4'-phosphopantetheinyl transferase family protein [Streptomyces sp. NPDC085481]|uniref:4'-phosphopantetheinyl transferase family protein n=1 Tax=Streptomyces sp. NPDC085481 TaxID=3365727 RepID=UPI0037D3C7F0
MTLSPPPPRGAELWLLRQPEPGTCTGVLDLDELDDTERSRAGTCRRESGRLLYSSAHIALRRLLGAYLDTAPAELVFGRAPCPCCDEPHGRPVLETPESTLHFSLSHGNGMALIGVSPLPIGVDVERVPTGETARVCFPALHPDERSELGGAADGVDAVSFGQLWTRKEAYLKGIGTGLARDLAADYLGADTARRPADWAVHDVPCGPRHIAAAALRGPEPVESLRVHWLPMDCLYRDDPRPLDKQHTFLGELVA